MTLEEQVYNAALADAAITAVIGDRFYLVQLPQNPTFPCAAYQRVSTQPVYVQSPDANQQGTVGWSRFRFQCWATGADSGQIAEAFAAAVLSMLQTFSGWSGPGAITQAPNFVLNRSMGIEPQTSPPLFKAVIDVKLWYRDQ